MRHTDIHFIIHYFKNLNFEVFENCLIFVLLGHLPIQIKENTKNTKLLVFKFFSLFSFSNPFNFFTVLHFCCLVFPFYNSKHTFSVLFSSILS